MTAFGAAINRKRKYWCAGAPLRALLGVTGAKVATRVTLTECQRGGIER